MIDEELLEIIEFRYPYPIAVECRKLSTAEYNDKDEKRLKRLFQIAEKTIAFISYISLSDIVERDIHCNVDLPKSLTLDFETRFKAVSFGTSIHLFRESIKTFKNNGIEPFVNEFIAIDSKASFFNSLDELVKLRNQIAHERSKLTVSKTAEYCDIAESNLQVILSGISFFTNYNLYWVNNISVMKARWKDAEFTHKFSKVTGVSDIFRSIEQTYPSYMESNSTILSKKGEFKYLNLFPLILNSDEGENQVPDIFFYSSWKNKNQILYSASNNGGVFMSKKSKSHEEIEEGLKVFLNVFSNPSNEK